MDFVEKTSYVVALKQTCCFTFLHLQKQFINGVPFDFKECAKTLLNGTIKSVLKGGTYPYSKYHTTAKAVRSLNNQVPSISSFQGLHYD